MLIDTYNQKGEKVGQTRLPSEVFGVKMSLDLVHQVAVSQAGNRRLVIAHTKGRGDVSGGGKKPWKQKGTGRARHGSNRSPIWIGGGVTFGPTNRRVFTRTIPKRMRRKALMMVLSSKAKDELLILIDSLLIEKPKTKLMTDILKTLPGAGKNSIIALALMDKNIILAGRNIDNLKVVQAKDLNVLDLLSYKYLILPKEAIKVIEKTVIEKDKLFIDERKKTPGKKEKSTARIRIKKVKKITGKKRKKTRAQ
ncbi:MAG: 50S ribosomal protein L4 [Candidatus Parcubacteria bacterium]|nr:50S ribosomal protein L4 [Candidatus Parcubacteria bacterium]